MTRLISVRYRVNVFATVDLDAEPDDSGWYPANAITRVLVADEAIRHDFSNPDSDDIDWRDTLEVAIEANIEDQIHPGALTNEEAAKAVEIADNTAWPTWENG